MSEYGSIKNAFGSLVELDFESLEEVAAAEDQEREVTKVARNLQSLGQGRDGDRAALPDGVGEATASAMALCDIALAFEHSEAPHVAHREQPPGGAAIDEAKCRQPVPAWAADHHTQKRPQLLA
ncbi:MAG: hypothetical protein OXG37_01855 [Actinomycetia bacterium]|nr:hypothetical protein [Actinomycetes bacterium]